MENFLVTFVAHNSRKSRRMQSLRIQTGEVLLFSKDDRILLKKILKSILDEHKNQVSLYAINVLDDHVHLVISVKFENLTNLIRELKSRSTYLYKKNYSIKENINLWARKFNSKILNTDKAIFNSIYYVENNHLKHSLEEI